MRRGMRKFLPEYKKVVFRAYTNEYFLHPVGRGELQEHLGIMGDFIRAEINDQLTVSDTVANKFRFSVVSVATLTSGHLTFL